MMRCAECGQKFGGVYVFTRHRLRRQDVCLDAAALKLRGFRRDRRGVWHQGYRAGQASILTAVQPQGSRTIEERTAQGAAGSSGTGRPSGHFASPPTQTLPSKGVAA